MRVLVGQSYHLRFDPKLWEAMEPYPPLGSLYAASVLRQAGYEVAFSDRMLETDIKSWRADLRQSEPSAVILYEDNFNYLSKMCLSVMREAAVGMIAAAKEQDCIVVVCGSDSSDQPGVYLDAGADYIIVGEGEETLVELLGFLSGSIDLDPEDIAGLAYRNAEGRLCRTERRPVLRDIDSIPMPAWDLIDLDRYRMIWHEHHGRFSVNLVSSRGCPYHCNWCAKPIWGQRYNCRSTKSVVDEISYLKTLTDFDHIWFMDDIFGLKPGWLKSFSEELVNANLSVTYKCLSRADLLLRPGEIQALRDSGAQTVWIGAESGNQQILDAMEKGTTIGQLEMVTHELRSAGIDVGHFIQFGYPGEDWSKVRDTIQLIRRLKPRYLGISVSYPLPGTPFYDRVRQQLGEQQNWRDSDDLAMMYDGPFSTAFYRILHRLVHTDRRFRNGLLTAFGAGNQPIGCRVRSLVSAMVAAANLLHLWPRLTWARIRSNGGHHGLQAELSPKAAATPSPQGKP